MGISYHFLTLINNDMINSCSPTYYKHNIDFTVCALATISNLFRQHAFTSALLREQNIRMESPHCWLILLDHWATWDSTLCTQSPLKASGLRDRQHGLSSSSHSSGMWERRAWTKSEETPCTDRSTLWFCLDVYIKQHNDAHWITSLGLHTQAPQGNVLVSNLQYSCKLKRLNWVWYSIFASIFRYNCRSVCVKLITGVEAGSLVTLVAAII